MKMKLSNIIRKKSNLLRLQLPWSSTNSQMTFINKFATKSQVIKPLNPHFAQVWKYDLVHS